MSVKLFYFHDPMCSWCWGFAPTWTQLQSRLYDELGDQLSIEYVLGGLAPDNDQPMPEEMQNTLQGYWRRIESLLGTQFNYDFWDQCQPRRSTYPACRAVIAAAKQNHEKHMIRAIQEAYYLRAMNPSDTATLEQLASELELKKEQFAQDLRSPETEQLLMEQIGQYRTLSANGFPSLVLALDSELIPIAIDYKRDETMFAMIKNTLKEKLQ
ncbi:DsbA family protein [Kangiella taiwanensis]|uniref:DsbA family protein n=1 Tax=Kangiella taiwanensis TaxID=1079179 RepID=A0ABP8I9I1_9GAMM|nr:DsbA family protein [Kangiella taiwanensis]